VRLTGLRPLLASQSWPPKSFNAGYYKNGQVDADIANALKTTKRAEKAKLYADAQKRIWNDAAWGFLVTEKNLYARSASLTGIYVMPDASFDFREIEMK
jgi:glutathione transport system substrate-binding protein